MNRTDFQTYGASLVFHKIGPTFRVVVLAFVNTTPPDSFLGYCVGGTRLYAQLTVVAIGRHVEVDRFVDLDVGVDADHGPAHPGTVLFCYNDSHCSELAETGVDGVRRVFYPSIERDARVAPVSPGTNEICNIKYTLSQFYILMYTSSGVTFPRVA